MDVILARLHRFHRLGDGLREQYRVDQIIHVARASSAEAAAEQHIVELDLAAVELKGIRRGLERDGLALRAAPHFGRIAGCGHRGNCV